MKTHVFYYRWPRNKLDLIHEEQDAILPDTVKAPKDAFFNFDGQWYMRGSQQYDPQRHGYFGVGSKAVTSFKLQEHQVPKEIRLHMLLLM